MGQYYKVVIGSVTGKRTKVYEPSQIVINGKKERIGAKLLEHGYLDGCIAKAMGKELMDTYRRVLWVGDYANGLSKDCKDPAEVSYLKQSSYYERVHQNVGKSIGIPTYEDVWGDKAGEHENLFEVNYHEEIHWASYYLVNKDKKEYVNLADYIHRSVYQWGNIFVVINPLAILTVVGNGLGSGDYKGTDMEMVGAWAWNLIGLTKTVPKGYKEITPTFMEI